MPDKKKPRITWTITIDPELADWIEREIGARRFANRSHAIEFCVDRQMSEENEAKIRGEQGNHEAPVSA